MSNPLMRLVKPLVKAVAPTYLKERHEMAFWRNLKAKDGRLDNSHYEAVFTDAFGLSRADFAGKRLLDVGCGPSGSLEWASDAAERVGVDPLADKYLRLGADRHAMTYRRAGSEAIPYADGHFDVVSALNSLDHVEDIAASSAELQRVCRPGGLVLLIVEVNHEPTDTEPHTLGWDVLDRFRPACDVVHEQRYEVGDHNLYRQILSGATWNDSDPSERPGMILARMRKR